MIIIFFFYFLGIMVEISFVVFSFLISTRRLLMRENCLENIIAIFTFVRHYSRHAKIEVNVYIYAFFSRHHIGFSSNCDSRYFGSCKLSQIERQRQGKISKLLLLLLFETSQTNQRKHINTYTRYRRRFFPSSTRQYYIIKCDVRSF